MSETLAAILHFIIIFGLFGILIAELMILSSEITGKTLKRLGIMDMHYGLLAVLVIATGLFRVFTLEEGPGAILKVPAFHIKMGLFIVIGILSIFPTVNIFKWKKQFKADGTLPEAKTIKTTRNVVLVEIFIFALIPIFAVLMAEAL